MTHRERAVAALNRKIPDRVPTFELEFQLAEEMLLLQFRAVPFAGYVSPIHSAVSLQDHSGSPGGRPVHH